MEEIASKGYDTDEFAQFMEYKKGNINMHIFIPIHLNKSLKYNNL